MCHNLLFLVFDKHINVFIYNLGEEENTTHQLLKYKIYILLGIKQKQALMISLKVYSKKE